MTSVLIAWLYVVGAFLVGYIEHEERASGNIAYPNVLSTLIAWTWPVSVPLLIVAQLLLKAFRS